MTPSNEREKVDARVQIFPGRQDTSFTQLPLLRPWCGAANCTLREFPTMLSFLICPVSSYLPALGRVLPFDCGQAHLGASLKLTLGLKVSAPHQPSSERSVSARTRLVAIHPAVTLCRRFHPLPASRIFTSNPRGPRPFRLHPTRRPQQSNLLPCCPIANPCGICAHQLSFWDVGCILAP